MVFKKKTMIDLLGEKANPFYIHNEVYFKLLVFSIKLDNMA